MSEHPQQTDRTLRDTRILTLRIWGVVGCIVIAAVIGYFFYTPDYYDKEGNLRYSREKGIGRLSSFWQSDPSSPL